MLEWIARLLVALAVAAGAQGIGTASDHASPGGSTHAQDAIQAIIDRLSAGDTQTLAGSQPDATGLDRASEVANDHAADGLDRAKAASGGDHGAPAAQPAPAAAPQVDAPPVNTPPVEVPPAQGPPATHPPVPAPPVTTPPVDAPGQGHRP